MEPQNLLPEYLTDHQVAAWLLTTPARVRRLANKGQIPHVSLPDGTLLFVHADLLEWSKTLPKKPSGVAS